MKPLSAQIYLGGQCIDFTICRKPVQVGLEPDRSLKKTAGEKFEDEMFNTDSGHIISEDKSNSDSEDSMVVALEIKEGGLQSQEEITNEEKFRRMGIGVAEKLFHILGGRKEESEKDVS